MKLDPIEAVVASVLAFRAHDELLALQVLPDEAALLERIRRHADTYRLVVQTIRDFMAEVAG